MHSIGIVVCKTVYVYIFLPFFCKYRCEDKFFFSVFEKGTLFYLLLF